jgi:hypothetical protein
MEVKMIDMKKNNELTNPMAKDNDDIYNDISRKPQGFDTDINPY